MFVQTLVSVFYIGQNILSEKHFKPIKNHLSHTVAQPGGGVTGYRAPPLGRTYILMGYIR